MQPPDVIKLLLVLAVIVMNGCAIQPEPVQVAESDSQLFGKLKTWEIEKSLEEENLKQIVKNQQNAKS